MTHTSTEQPELLKLADDLDGDWTTVAHMRRAAISLRFLHARVQELEASQAQRVPLSDAEAWEVINATHNLEHFDPYEHNALFDVVRATEAAHGITQEKQG